MPSRSACARLVEEGSVTINTCEATSKSEKVLLGDRVTCELKVEEKGAEAGLLTPNPEIPLDIRYEDEHLIVLSKQAGLVWTTLWPTPSWPTAATATWAFCRARTARA